MAFHVTKSPMARCAFAGAADDARRPPPGPPRRLPSAPPARPVSAEGAGVIRGKATRHQDGRPEAGVTVVASGPAGEFAEITGKDGTFELALPPGLYNVNFYPDGGDRPVARYQARVSPSSAVTIKARLLDAEPIATGCGWRIPESPITSDAQRSTTYTRDYLDRIPLR